MIVRLAAAAAAAAALLLCVMVARAEDIDMRARYERAIEYLPWRITSRVYGPGPSLHLEPHWEADGRSFTYEERTRGGLISYRVDPDARTRTKLAAAKTEPAAPPNDGIARSPDGTWGVQVVDGNLFAISMRDGVKRQLTTDAAPDYLYASMPESDLNSLRQLRSGLAAIPQGVWSPDGTRFLTQRVDERGIYKMPMVLSAVPGATHQIPWLHTQNTPLPGSERLPMMEAVIFEMRSGKRIDISTPAPMIYGGELMWGADGRTVFLTHESADFRRPTVLAADSATGVAHVAAADESALTLRGSRWNGERLTVVGNGTEIVLYSGRDGWPHYYLYDTATGRVKNRITRGEWAVHEVRHVDARGRWLYFTAGGRERGRDPYYSHLYRVRLDGSALTLLTPENAQHDIQFAPGGGYFIDTFSTVATPPVVYLRAADGRRVMELLRTDIAGLLASGWRAPQRQVFKAADGTTDIYGTVFLPADAAQGKRHPLIDFIYAGPSIAVAPRRFLQEEGLSFSAAELGFVALTLDARGTPLRSRSFQDVSFGKGFGSAEIMADHVAAIRQLAQRCGCVDLERVGISGSSWGGYRVPRAMFQFPDFFKVGVAMAGSHDNYLYVFGHDRFLGREAEVPGTYLAQSNIPLAGALQGRLLLIHGEADGIVHPANTLQLADALIRANKDFDMLILPDRDHHEIHDDGYVVRREWDYFVRHLLGVEPPRGIRVPGN